MKGLKIMLILCGLMLLGVAVVAGWLIYKGSLKKVLPITLDPL